MDSVEDDEHHMEDEGHHEEEVVTEEDDSQNDVVEESILSNDVSVEPSRTPIYPIYVVPEDDKSKTQVVIYHDDSIR